MRTVAVVGATGVVGREFCRTLGERRFPADAVRLFASARSAGARLRVCDREVTVEDVEGADLAGIDLAFFSAGGANSKRLAPRFAAEGAYVVDNSSAFRMDPTVPLVVPEVNATALDDFPGRIIANPNCSTIILLMPLAPLHRRFGVQRVIVSTYQAVSGAGRAALDELDAQTRAWAKGDREPTQVFDRPIHRNLIPQIGALGEDGVCEEERKVVLEAQKILGAPELVVLPTTVRVPIERCHSESVYVELARPAYAHELRAAWTETPNLVVIDGDDPRRWPTPRELAGTWDTAVGRLRQVPGRDDAWMFWVVADQLLKGAALNAIQIGEALVASGRC